MEPVKIMPCLDMKEGRVVKGVNFINLHGACSHDLPAGIQDHPGSGSKACIKLPGDLQEFPILPD
jgi:imidazole glycerol-phosphate synthase subunit HisF